MSVIQLRSRPQILEFFAGVGLARMGLDLAGFETAWANDISPDKAAMYRAQFGDDVMVVGDVNDIDAADLPASTSRGHPHHAQTSRWRATAPGSQARNPRRSTPSPASCAQWRRTIDPRP
ncbi:hypothetical protein G9444_6765 (plasmid) [Rhodococcus erythropolis]|uniref:Uncharacterized protein n=1 Tax=Rhodococcus erythropolis TaxID=1833 RepID=A0A6G9D4C4_RHOER|nr:hypothetical protein G9444_6765 [Rhodococcus erythropolis]